jgi:hypothetical protein
MKKKNLKIWMLISMTIVVLSCGDGGKSDVVVEPPCDCETIYFNKEKERYLTVDGDKLFTGTCESKYGDGKVKKHMEIENGVVNGEQRLYYESGQLKSLTNKSPNDANEHYVEYYENGYKKTESYGKDKIFEQVASIYYYDNGYPKEVYFKDDIDLYQISEQSEGEYSGIREETNIIESVSLVEDGRIYEATGINIQCFDVDDIAKPFNMQDFIEKAEIALNRDCLDRYDSEKYSYDDKNMDELNKFLKDLVQTKPSK